MAWVEVCRAGEVPEGQVKVFEVQGHRIALCHTDRQNFYAIQDVCTHDNGPLGEGELFGNVIECPRHGARFDVKTGKVLALPAVTPIQTYPVKMEEEKIKVELES